MKIAEAYLGKKGSANPSGIQKPLDICRPIGEEWWHLMKSEDKRIEYRMNWVQEFVSEMDRRGLKPGDEEYGQFAIFEIDFQRRHRDKESMFFFLINVPLPEAFLVPRKKELSGIMRDKLLRELTDFSFRLERFLEDRGYPELLAKQYREIKKLASVAGVTENVLKYLVKYVVYTDFPENHPKAKYAMKHVFKVEN